MGPPGAGKKVSWSERKETTVSSAPILGGYPRCHLDGLDRGLLVLDRDHDSPEQASPAQDHLGR